MLSAIKIMINYIFLKCFIAISSWLNYLLVNDRLKTLSGSYGKNARFFVGQNSQFMEPLMALVKNHIEDLVFVNFLLPRMSGVYMINDV